MLRLLNAYTILVNQSDHLSHVHDSNALNIEKTVLEQSNTAQHHQGKKQLEISHLLEEICRILV